MVYQWFYKLRPIDRCITGGCNRCQIEFI